MTSLKFICRSALLGTTFIAILGLASQAIAATSEDLNKDSFQALQTLYKTEPVAHTLSGNAKAVLVFPKMIKAGLVFGGAYGEGTLLKGNSVVDYYNSVAATWGLQAGAQSYAYVMFLMTDEAVEYVEKTQGWEVGVGPTVILVDKGAALNLSTTTLKNDAYAFIFSQEGLMAGINIEGTKISKINR